MSELFPPSPDVEIIDRAEPFVQAEVTKNSKGYGWVVKARVRGDNVVELLRLISQAEDQISKKYGAQAKEVDGKL